MYDKDLRRCSWATNTRCSIWRALSPPAAEAEPFRHVLAAFNRQDLLANNLLPAGDQGQALKVKTLLRKLNANDKTLKARAMRLGLHTCAKE
jgi:hypothetical protein